MVPEWKTLAEAFVVETTSNLGRASEIDNLRIQTGLSYREILEDVVETLNEKEYRLILSLLRKKYGFIG